MRSLLITILCTIAATCFVSDIKAAESEIYAGAGLAFQNDNGLLGLEARGMYYVSPKMAVQVMATYYLIGLEDNQSMFSFSPSVRYDIIQLKKLDLYARLGYTYVSNTIDPEGTLADRDYIFHQINPAFGVQIPISSFELYGEIDLPYQLDHDEINGGLRTVFRAGVVIPL
jgi:hypothetical protein